MKAEYVDHMGTDKSVVRSARVSFAKDGDVDFDGPLSERDIKLINYLVKHKHWTPMAHTAITLRMTAPIPIRTQCFKHKVGFTENEESRRYIKSTPEIFYPLFRESVSSKKQGSGELLPEVTREELIDAYHLSVTSSVKTYEELLEEGVCEEQARLVLPQGCMVQWYWTGSLSAFARFYRQRTDPHAQLEIQQLAHMVGKVIQPLFPVSWEALTGEMND